MLKKKIDSSAAAVRDVLKMHLLIPTGLYDEVGELHYTPVVMTNGGGGGVPVGKEIAGLIFPRPLGHDRTM